MGRDALMLNVTFCDIINVEVEHGLGETVGPFVVLRVMTDTDVIAYSQLGPAQAREIAEHLITAAARAEYESDLFGELRRVEMPDDAIGLILHAVRHGEIRRETNIGSDPA